MYLFSRRTRMLGSRTRDAIAWAVGQTERVNRITGLQVSLYAQVFSPELGTIAWSTFVPDLATLEAAADKLTVDDEYMAAAEAGSDLLMGGADDALAQVLYGQPDPSRQVEYATVVHTACANGKIARGVELGIEIAQRAEQITGTPTMFLMDTTGIYGGVGWVTGHTDIGAMEAGEQALLADSSWVELIDREVAGVYTDEATATTQLIYRRMT